MRGKRPLEAKAGLGAVWCIISSNSSSSSGSRPGSGSTLSSTAAVQNQPWPERPAAHLAI